MVIIKNYKVKNYLTNFRKDWNKFPEIFHGKFPEIFRTHNPNGDGNTTNTVVLPYSTCQQIVILAKIREKNLFIDRVNKLEVFKLNTDYFWCNWCSVVDSRPTAQLKCD